MTDWACTTAAAALRSGEIAPLDLVEHCLDRIARYDSQIRAWVMVDGDGARKDATRLAEELARGYDRGPLHGIPIGIKDIIDVDGWPTLAASPLRAGHVATRDADVVTRLRRAGAIIFGKTVTCEFACFDPSPTRNPWNLERTPGGSSSGSAAAVAMGMCLGAVGTQTGGSITRPATYCGVAGFKPAYGAIPTDGVLAVSPTLDHVGAIARTVADLEVMVGAMSDSPPIGRATDDEPPSVMLASGFFMRDIDLSAYSQSMELLSSEARGPQDIPPPSKRPILAWMESTYDLALVHHRTIMAYEAARTHRDHFHSQRSSYGLQIASLLDEGRKISDRQYQAAMHQRDRFRAGLLDLVVHFDALFTPATPTAATSLKTTGDAHFNSPFSFAGVPTISVPCGLDHDGMPVAIQFIGHPDRVDRLIAAARWFEERIDFTARPPLLT